MTYKHGPVEIRAAGPGDAAALGPRLREADLAEVHLSGFPDGAAALAYGLARSVEAWTLLIDGLPAAMFGLNPKTLMGSEAVVWLLGAPELGRIKKTFMRLSPHIIAEWSRRFPVLYNLVPRDYAKSLAWLRWLGVNVDKPVTVDGQDWQLVAFARGS